MSADAGEGAARTEQRTWEDACEYGKNDDGFESENSDNSDTSWEAIERASFQLSKERVRQARKRTLVQIRRDPKDKKEKQASIKNWLVPKAAQRHEFSTSSLLYKPLLHHGDPGSTGQLRDTSVSTTHGISGGVEQELLTRPFGVCLHSPRSPTVDTTTDPEQEQGFTDRILSCCSVRRSDDPRRQEQSGGNPGNNRQDPVQKRSRMETLI